MTIEVLLRYRRTWTWGGKQIQKPNPTWPVPGLPVTHLEIQRIGDKFDS